MADIVLLSTADWDHPLWTNKQHVACALAAEGERVLYVESLGLRSVQAKSQDFSRIFRRLFRGLRLVRVVRPGVWVLSPLVWPGGNPWVCVAPQPPDPPLQRGACVFCASFSLSLVVDLQPFDVALPPVEGFFSLDLSRS